MGEPTGSSGPGDDFGFGVLGSGDAAIWAGAESGEKSDGLPKGCWCCSTPFILQPGALLQGARSAVRNTSSCTPYRMQGSNNYLYSITLGLVAGTQLPAA